MARPCSHCTIADHSALTWESPHKELQTLCQSYWAKLNDGSIINNPSHNPIQKTCEYTLASDSFPSSGQHALDVADAHWCSPVGMPANDPIPTNLIPWVDVMGTTSSTVYPSSHFSLPNTELDPALFFTDYSSRIDTNSTWPTLPSRFSTGTSNSENLTNLSLWPSPTSHTHLSQPTPFNATLTPPVPGLHQSMESTFSRKSGCTSTSPTPSNRSIRTRVARSRRGSPGSDSCDTNLPQKVRLEGGVRDDTKDVIKVNVATPRAVAASIRRREIEALFHCDVPGCRSSFTRKHNLDNHARSHYDERRYVCKWCHRAFVRKTDCDRHETRNCKSRGDIQPLFAHGPLLEAVC